ncbi:MAG: hypothetical protein ABI791_08380 [Acidobacteriota bacterium]
MTERINVKQAQSDERISQRLIDGVRVIEKETHRIIKLVGSRYVDASSKREPRLVVVDDAGSNPQSFITKDRTSIAGLSAILQCAIR